MQYQKINFILLVAFILLNSCYSKNRKEDSEVGPMEKELAVVELFTSEGCSSCPKADALLEKISLENKDILALSYHVDYWDRLGWKDPFSQATFSDRQRGYGLQFNLESIYTPQMVINGKEEFVGSDEQRLRNSLSKLLPLTKLDVKVTRKDTETITLNYNPNSVTQSGSLYIAFVQPEATTIVRRGENNGRTLRHINVVRQLTSVENNSTHNTELKIPASLQTIAFKAILFVQSGPEGRISAASSVPIPRY